MRCTLLLYALALALACALGAAPDGADAATYSVLHRFSSADGVLPSANGISPYGLIADKAGNLYGVTLYDSATPGGCECGTIFELSPPVASGGAWIETTLYSFTGGAEGTGVQPYLAMDKSGSLYGEMAFGGDDTCDSTYGCGTVFKLAPPTGPNSSWAFEIIHTFHDQIAGGSPTSQLVIDPSGTIYGTTSIGGGSTDCGGGCGVAFKLVSPVEGQTAWSYSVIHSFGHEVNGATPFGPLIADANGALYGAAAAGGAGYGTLFRLTPPVTGQNLWSSTSIHTFRLPANGYSVLSLALGQNGVLYGSAEVGGDNCLDNNLGCGTLFSLAPPPSGQELWTYTVLHTFDQAANGAEPDMLVLDPGGTLYGTTFAGGKGPCYLRCGTIFSLSPPISGQKLWHYTVLQSIGHPVNGALPWGTIVEGPSKMLYGTTGWGGDPDCKNGQASNEDVAGCGVIYQLTP